MLNGASEDNPPTLTWQVPYLLNPRGTVTSGMFNVTLYSLENEVLYYFNQTTGPTVTMEGVS